MKIAHESIGVLIWFRFFFFLLASHEVHFNVQRQTKNRHVRLNKKRGWNGIAKLRQYTHSDALIQSNILCPQSNFYWFFACLTNIKVIEITTKRIEIFFIFLNRKNHSRILFCRDKNPSHDSRSNQFNILIIVIR